MCVKLGWKKVQKTQRLRVSWPERREEQEEGEVFQCPGGGGAGELVPVDKGWSSCQTAAVLLGSMKPLYFRGLLKP